jgi:acyl carrier protein
VDNPSIKQQVRIFISTNFYIADASQFLDDASLLDEGVIDSTGVIEVIHFLETTFGITIEDQEIVPNNLDSIARIAGFIARKRAASEPSVSAALTDSHAASSVPRAPGVVPRNH